MDNTLRIAITGSHGFVAQHLADRFIAEGHKVAGVPRELLMDQSALTDYFKELQPHYIFHLASYGNMVSHDIEDEVFATNIVKTYFLLQSLKGIDYKGFVNISSSSVYGTKSSPMNERDVLDTDTLYGVTKASAEGLTRYFARKYNKPNITGRFFTVIGEGEQEEHLIPQLIQHGLSGKKMKFVKDPTHDFIDVSDAIDALLVLSLYANEHKGEVFNIGTGIYWTNGQIKEAVENEMGVTIKTKDVDSMRAYDSNKWVADPTKLKMLGWYPKMQLEDTITRMVAYEKQRFEKKNT